MNSDLKFEWEVKEDRLCIKTLVDNMNYYAQWKINPDIELEDITFALDDNTYRLKDKTIDFIKIKAGSLNLELKNMDKANINQMELTIKKLNDRVKELQDEVKDLKLILSSKCPLHFAPQILLDVKFHESSKIVKLQQEKFLKQFMEPKKINFLKMLYRASENDFSVSKFHLKCDGVPNTLVLVETQYGRVIGGFNPFGWESCRKPDLTYSEKEAFIFSLSHNQKFALKDKRENMVFNEINYGPIFGNGRDLVIADRANTNEKSYAKINTGSTSYHHNNYNQLKTQQSWERFCGNKNEPNFRIKEWQVWYVDFL